MKFSFNLAIYIENLQCNVRFIISDTALISSAIIHYHQTSRFYFDNWKTKQKYNATKSIFKLASKPEVYSSRITLIGENGLIKFFCVWPTVFI